MLTVETAGKADRFRAYAKEDMLRRPNAEDNRKRAAAGLPPFNPGDRIRYAGEEIFATGEVGKGSVTVPAGETVVTRVVFYAGPVDSEAVVGSIDVGAAGDVEINVVEGEPIVPVAAPEPTVYDE